MDALFRAGGNGPRKKVKEAFGELDAGFGATFATGAELRSGYPGIEKPEPSTTPLHVLFHGLMRGIDLFHPPICEFL